MLRFFRRAIEKHTLNYSIRRLRNFHAEMIGATAAWRAARLDPLGMELLATYSSVLADLEPKKGETFSSAASLKMREMLDQWLAAKPEMVSAAKQDFAEVWYQGVACGIAPGIEAHISRTFDLMGDLVVRNAVKTTAELGVTRTERVIN